MNFLKMSFIALSLLLSACYNIETPIIHEGDQVSQIGQNYGVDKSKKKFIVKEIQQSKLFGIAFGSSHYEFSENDKLVANILFHHIKDEKYIMQFKEIKKQEYTIYPVIISQNGDLLVYSHLVKDDGYKKLLTSHNVKLSAGKLISTDNDNIVKFMEDASLSYLGKKIGAFINMDQ